MVNKKVRPGAVLGEVGYSGKGMCKTCWYSTEKVLPGRGLVCIWYHKPCARVSWNCPGVPALKNTGVANHVRGK